MYSKLLTEYPISKFCRVQKVYSRIFGLLLLGHSTDQTPGSVASGDVSMGSADDYSHGDELFPQMSMHLTPKMSLA